MWGENMDGSLIDTGGMGKKRGPHLESRLTAAFVRSAPPGRHTDGGGLYLQVDATGARRWLLRLTVRGRRRDYGLGSARIISLADARAKALELRRVVAGGGNPRSYARAVKGKDITFSEMARRVHERKFKDRKNNGKHIAQWIRTLETYAFPTIGSVSVDDIHQDEIEHILDPIWTSKPETARRVLQRISTVFDHACGAGFRTRGNPAQGLARLMRDQRDKPKNFVALDYANMPHLWRILSRSSSVGAYALRFTILTALRSGTVRLATWDQFDESLEEWTIPGENMKGREKFVVPLSMPAKELLKALRETRSPANHLVFPSPSNPSKIISENTMRKLLQSHYPTATVHGMRAAFRTWAAEVANARDDVAETALAHVVGSKTVRAYNRTEHLDERHMLMEQWGLWVTGDHMPFNDMKTINGEIMKRWVGGENL
ncbi:hypothetical protein B5M07_07170 [Sulfitobacter sp. D7]|nr:hypothetical protein B5M07_07170 [Sulfitobacter sp. D7]